MLIVLDVNETLLDLAALDPVFERHTGRAGTRRAWFDLVIRSALVSAATGRYEDFGALAAGAARTFVEPDAGDALVADLGPAMRRLEAHDDVVPALTAWHQAGHRLVVLANSPLAVVTAQLEHAGIDSHVDAIVSAEQAGALKPSPAAYLHVLRQEGVDAADATLVAAHDWDVAGAQSVGMAAVHVDRGLAEPLPSWPAPDRVRDLGDVSWDAVDR